jgi:hypothetical protein
VRHFHPLVEDGNVGEVVELGGEEGSVYEPSIGHLVTEIESGERFEVVREGEACGRDGEGEYECEFPNPLWYRDGV